MLQISDVPFRKWSRDGHLTECREGKRVMALAFREMKAGRAVEVTISHALTTAPNKPRVAAINELSGKTYDKISLTVTD